MTGRLSKEWESYSSAGLLLPLLDTLRKETPVTDSELAKAPLFIGSGFWGIRNRGSVSSAGLIQEIRLNTPFKAMTLNYNACSAGLTAFHQAFFQIRQGITDQAMVFASDRTGDYALSGFYNLKAHSLNGCRPFGKDRDGLTVSEGAVLIFLSAEKKDAWAEVKGAGASSDNAGVTAMDKSGDGIGQAVSNALAMTENGWDGIDLVAAHGTGTIQNDRLESEMLNRLSGRSVPVYPFKQITGHMMGAGGAVQLALSAYFLQKNFWPSVRSGYPVLDGCEFYSDETHGKVRGVLCNAFGFGGVNFSAVLRSCDP
jgi:3-oxoacyl-(acyl-carrier-protein) synthase